MTAGTVNEDFDWLAAELDATSDPGVRAAANAFRRHLVDHLGLDPVEVNVILRSAFDDLAVVLRPLLSAFADAVTRIVEVVTSFADDFAKALGITPRTNRPRRQYEPLGPSFPPLNLPPLNLTSVIPPPPPFHPRRGKT